MNLSGVTLNTHRTHDKTVLEVPVEIERRYLIAEPHRLPALGIGTRYVQCYPPAQAFSIIGEQLVFEGVVLVGGLSKAQAWSIDSLLNNETGCTPRLRIAGDDAFVTIKGRSVGPSRIEWEFEVVRELIRRHVESWRWPTVVKRRFCLTGKDGSQWVVDRFEGSNAGLWLAEIELDEPMTNYSLPYWLGPEVTTDSRYGSGGLARSPWRDWSS